MIGAAMSFDSPRMKRERKTVEAMIHIYCRGVHPEENTPCSDCRELLDHAWMRLEKCPFQEGKTPCARCPVHCYTPAMRQSKASEPETMSLSSEV